VEVIAVGRALATRALDAHEIDLESNTEQPLPPAIEG
jgi:hypothetical protein